MALAEYLADVAMEMRAQSASIRRDFATHRLSAGENREDLVERFLGDHLPRRFGVSTGLVISRDGKFSNQADLVVVDDQNNAPLYAAARNRLWPVEAVYALIEVKTNLSPSDLSDAVSKCRKFKSLQREYCDSGLLQRIRESLFVIWAFESPASETFKRNLLEVLTDVPVAEQPDFVIVPDRLVARSGAYLELSVLGQPNSGFRQQLEAQHGGDLSSLMPEPAVVYDMSENSLLAWFIWFDSWLRMAGVRLTTPLAYVPERTFGRRV